MRVVVDRRVHIISFKKHQCFTLALLKLLITCGIASKAEQTRRNTHALNKRKREIGKAKQQSNLYYHMRICCAQLSVTKHSLLPMQNQHSSYHSVEINKTTRAHLDSSSGCSMTNIRGCRNLVSCETPLLRTSMNKSLSCFGHLSKSFLSKSHTATAFKPQNELRLPT